MSFWILLKNLEIFCRISFSNISRKINVMAHCLAKVGLVLIKAVPVLIGLSNQSSFVLLGLWLWFGFAFSKKLFYFYQNQIM